MSIIDSSSNYLPPSLRGMHKYFITAKKETALHELLSSHLPSTCNVQIILSAGGVWKNKKRIFDPHHLMGPGETVKIHTSSFQGQVFTLTQQHIIFENNDMLIVYKPGDLNVHGVPSSCFYNLTFGVNQYLKEKGIHFESTPVTRLDRPVEGLVIFPKNKISERTLFELVKTRKIQKWYMAALEKKDNPSHIHIRDRISNDGNRTIPDENGKFAHSYFHRTHTFETADIYSVFIFTGRRHQIRFHASTYLSPIIGDWFYHSRQPFDYDNTDRIALLCRGYNITYRKQRLCIRLPQAFIQDFLNRFQTPSS